MKQFTAVTFLSRGNHLRSHALGSSSGATSKNKERFIIQASSKCGSVLKNFPESTKSLEKPQTSLLKFLINPGNSQRILTKESQTGQKKY